MAQVVLQDIQKRYPGGVQAVRDLSLNVADGEFLVLLGPSGCGKSTILRLVAGLEDPTAGTIRIGDRQVNDLSPRHRNIAMVFQSYALYPHMTVEKNIAFGLKTRQVPRGEIQRRVRETADLLGIGDLLPRKPKALSGGQQQRVALGRAIVREPDCFLFDEPLSNLDARLRLQMRVELRRLHQRLETTTLHVTHDQEEAMTLGDRVVVLCNGEVQQIARPLEVYREPANSFVAGFVGSPPINLVSGHVAASNGQLRFDGGRGLQVPLPELATAVDGQEAVLGVRPEACRVVGQSAAAGADSAQLSVTVVMAELVGDRMDLHARTDGGTPIVARVEATDAIQPDQRVELAVTSQSLHLFEPGPFGSRIR